MHGAARIASTPAPASRPHRALAPAAPVALRAAACLRLRSRASACRDCAQACPCGALEVGAAGPVLGAGCTGCGRCQAACPMAALAVEGFGPTAAPARRIECLRSPDVGDATVVPCLGGLSPGRLLAWCAADPAQALVLVDRGLCGGCDSGGPVHPAAAAVARAGEWLAAAGVPEVLRPRLERRAAGGAAGVAAGSDPLQSRGRARRRLFGALAAPAAAGAAAAEPLARRVPSDERRTTLAALAAVAAHHGHTLPQALLPGLGTGPGCQGHRVCAAACPTGALQRFRDEGAGRIGIHFDARDCIACGACAAACPAAALSLQPGAGRAARVALASFESRACPDCGTRFAEGDGESRCERCRKSARLAGSAYASLFGARP